jgi:hypothetical protein
VSFRRDVVYVFIIIDVDINTHTHMWCSGSYEHIYLRGREFESPWGLFF